MLRLRCEPNETAQQFCLRRNRAVKQVALFWEHPEDLGWTPRATPASIWQLPRLRARQRIRVSSSAAKLDFAELGQKEIRRLNQIVEKNEAAAKAGRWSQAVKYNQEFHFALVEGADMPILLAILSRLWLRMGPLIAGYYAREQIALVRHHQTIVAACENRDPAAAAAAMRADIDDAKEGIIRYIESFTTND